MVPHTGLEPVTPALQTSWIGGKKREKSVCFSLLKSRPTGDDPNKPHSDMRLGDSTALCAATNDRFWKRPVLDPVPALDMGCAGASKLYWSVVRRSHVPVSGSSLMAARHTPEVGSSERAHAIWPSISLIIWVCRRALSGVCLVNLLLEPPIYRKSSRGNSSRLKSKFDVCYVQIAGADAAAWVQAQGMAAVLMG